MKRSLAKVVKENYNGDYGEAVRNLRQIERELQFERAKKMLKDNGGKIPYHRWYKGEKYNYQAYGANKGKVTGYFKTELRRYGTGGRRIFTYYKAHETGVLVFINESMCKMGMTQGLSTPNNFQPSNKREWTAAYKTFMKMIN
jgi:hypothetical protein